MSGDVIRLAGREFREVGVSTVEHDLVFWRCARKAGLHNATMQDGETPEEFARRLLDQIVDAGVTLELVATMIVPVDSPTWTAEKAADVAAFLGGISDPKDKATFNSIVLSTLAYFFDRGLTSLWSSRTSSGDDAGMGSAPKE